MTLLPVNKGSFVQLPHERNSSSLLSVLFGRELESLKSSMRGKGGLSDYACVPVFIMCNQRDSSTVASQDAFLRAVSQRIGVWQEKLGS